MSLTRDFDDENSDTANRAVPGAPPDFSHVAFDPLDPDSVKVHYDVSAWSLDNRAELSEVLAEMSVPHSWDEDELVVPEEIEGPVDLIFEALENELGPFAVPLEEGADEVAYELDEWPARDITLIAERLTVDRIPHRWDDRTLVVGADDEESVDALLDEVEAAAQSAVGAPAAPSSTLGDLYKVGKQLQKNPLHSKARRSLFKVVDAIEGRSAPDGLEPGEWAPIAQLTVDLKTAFDADDPEPDEIEELARRLSEATHSWV